MTDYDFAIYARVKCGERFQETALSFVNDKLEEGGLSLREIDFYLGVRLLLENK